MEKTAHHASLTRKALIVILLKIIILWDKKHEN